ncbi:unannotated protein [freshwater metagenome]|uniref:Unannotated protein n=1 Tax=freshwater metagenome TaxID=449393 RepID=A0A6J5YMP4_9ZZZZ
MAKKSAQLSVTNRLAASTSPYLQAHADNPVDWYEWGDEAFDAAKQRGVPVFLSVGYSACHWCHVMAHESFENPHIAELMNENFVNVKVDREELPTIDALYMQATQALTGHGGWPMSVWLDHDRRPWYAGTYFPPVPSHSSPSFAQVLVAIDDAWRNERQKVDFSAQRLIAAISATKVISDHQEQSSQAMREACANAVEQLAHSFDPVYGGFGNAPKFPPASVLKFLMRWEALNRIEEGTSDLRIMTMVDVTCEQMARGGIYDQIGGGFSRYSVDDKWAVPHFEKMLYDNAQLISVYTQWWLLTGNALAKRIVSEVCDFLISDMTTQEGAFACAFDADSIDDTGHLVEGAFYAWKPDQIQQVLDSAGVQVSELLGISAEGNFEHGYSVPSLKRDPKDLSEWHTQRGNLHKARSTRNPPQRDDKVIASWNALAISALARAGRVFAEPRWIAAAARAADVLVSVHLGAAADEPTTLMRVSRDGKVSTHAVGTLEDYALLTSAFLDLAQATDDQSWVSLAQMLVHEIDSHFVDGGQLIDLSKIAQQKLGIPEQVLDITDNVLPSAWSATVEALVTVAALTGDSHIRARAESYLGPMIGLVAKHGRFAGNCAAVLTSVLDGPREVAVVAKPDSFMVDHIARMTAPGAVYTASESSPLMQGRTLINDLDAVYVCREFVCQQPLTDLAEISQSLGIFH